MTTHAVRRGAVAAALTAMAVVPSAHAQVSTVRDAGVAPPGSSAEPALPAPATMDDGAGPPAAAPSNADAPTARALQESIGDLRRAVERQDQELRALKQASAQDRAAAVALRVSGYVQVDLVPWNQLSQDEVDPSTGAPLNQTRVLLRRGRVRLDADVGLVAGALELDANTVNGPQVRPINAEASVRWPPRRGEPQPIVMATLGLIRIPFGFEVQERDYERPFLERATVLRALFPGEFDLGARVKGGGEIVNYALAVMNGHPLGEAAFPGVTPTEAKDIVGRIGADTKFSEALAADFGISGVTGTGFHKGTPSTKDQLVWRDDNQDGIVQPTEIQVIAGKAGAASQTFHRFALGLDVRVRAQIPLFGEMALRTELVWGKNLDRGIQPADPIGAGRDLREFGGYVGLTQELGHHAMVGARYDAYNPDADASEAQGAAVVPRDRHYATLAMMALVHHGPGRLTLEFDHNRNPLGRAASGTPTTLASDALTLRGQVMF